MVFGAWLALLGFGLTANLVFEFVIRAGLVTGVSATIVKALAGLYIVASGMVITVLAFFDLISLANTGFRSMRDDKSDD